MKTHQSRLTEVQRHQGRRQDIPSPKSWRGTRSSGNWSRVVWRDGNTWQKVWFLVPVQRVPTWIRLFGLLKLGILRPGPKQGLVLFPAGWLRLLGEEGAPQSMWHLPCPRRAGLACHQAAGSRPLRRLCAEGKVARTWHSQSEGARVQATGFMGILELFRLGFCLRTVLTWSQVALAAKYWCSVAVPFDFM